MSENGKFPYSLKVGITGGIGSGKTTVCRIFETLGIPVYYADDRAKALMTESKEVVQAVKALLGPDAYHSDGTLNRSYISDIVFADPRQLAGLNAIVHPAVFRDGEAWHQNQKDTPYTLKEAALLVESGSHRSLDKLIVVTAPEDIRIDRVVKRDGVPREAVKSRMRHQLPESEKAEHADFIIRNDGSASLIWQVWQIHRKLVKEAKNRSRSANK